MGKDKWLLWEKLLGKRKPTTDILDEISIIIEKSDQGEHGMPHQIDVNIDKK